MTKLKAAGRPLTLKFNGSMPANEAANAGLLAATGRIDVSPAASPCMQPAPAPAAVPATENILGAPTAEEAAAKGATSVVSPLVTVSTEHTWSEAGPLGLKLLQKGQHKEDKYGV